MVQPCKWSLDLLLALQKTCPKSTANLNETLVVPLGFEPRSGEPESSMMDRYTKGLCPCQFDSLLEIDGGRNLKHLRSGTSSGKPMRAS